MPAVEVGSSSFAGTEAQRKVVDFDYESECCIESRAIAVNTKSLHASLRLRRAFLNLLVVVVALNH